MPKLIGLPGVACSSIDYSKMFKTVSGAMRLLALEGVASSSGDTGAINIWLRDDQSYQVERYKYHVEQSSEIFPVKADVRRWLEVNFPLIRGG